MLEPILINSILFTHNSLQDIKQLPKPPTLLNQKVDCAIDHHPKSQKMYESCHTLGLEVLQNGPLLKQNHAAIERLKQNNPLTPYVDLPQLGCHNCKIISKDYITDMYVLNPTTRTPIDELTDMFFTEGRIQKERQSKKIFNTFVLIEAGKHLMKNTFDIEFLFQQTDEDIFKELFYMFQQKLGKHKGWTLTLHPTGFILENKLQQECRFLFATRMLQSRLYKNKLVLCFF